MDQKKEELSFKTAVAPIAVFFMLILYGLFIHPQFVGGGMLPVEIMVLLAFSFNSISLLSHGYSWKVIESHVSQKVKEAIPVVMILLCIGVLIGSWIVSGTIPMLIYYGISVISADWIYLFSFVICILFSLLTGTSWGSAGTIGVVMIGIAQVYGADTTITAAAIVGGSFFGDKLSPLSDTTNIASLATDVELMDHIKSMLYTTLPAAIIAAIIYGILSIHFGNTVVQDIQVNSIADSLIDLSTIFHFHILLLLPLVIVLWGAASGRSIVLTLLFSAWTAMMLAFISQDFSIDQIFQAFNKGFDQSMIGEYQVKSGVIAILNRGGLYNLIEGVVICLLIFAFIGTLQVTDAIQRTLSSIMNSLRSARATVMTTLLTTLLVNLTTSNQYATSFIIGEAFKKKYDQLKIHRKVLSRSIEDAGTMMENLAPWTPSGIFMLSALGVSAIDYAPYQFMSLANIIIAMLYALTGIAIFKKTENHE